MMGSSVDRERTEALAASLMLALIPTLRQTPHSRENALICLNALAFALCPVIAGTDFDHEALTFFRRALAENLVETARQHGLLFDLPAWLEGAANDA